MAVHGTMAPGDCHRPHLRPTSPRTGEGWHEAAAVRPPSRAAANRPGRRPAGPGNAAWNPRLEPSRAVVPGSADLLPEQCHPELARTLGQAPPPVVKLPGSPAGPPT